MPVIISISTSVEDQARAAATLSDRLRDLGCGHAFIGGFAWSLLGSRRLTEHDIDVLVNAKAGMAVLRSQLRELDRHFAQHGIAFYFVKEVPDDTAEEDLVRRSRNNVLIETLPTGSLGLPVVAEPIYLISSMGYSLPILHPSILILTKMKRWYMNESSTRPKTVSKNRSDQEDIRYIIYWLAAEKLCIRFDLYQGKPREELLCMVRRYHDKFTLQTTLVGKLRSIIQDDDWISMMELPEAQVSEAKTSAAKAFKAKISEAKPSDTKPSEPESLSYPVAVAYSV